MEVRRTADAGGWMRDWNGLQTWAAVPPSAFSPATAPATPVRASPPPAFAGAAAAASTEGGGSPCHACASASCGVCPVALRLPRVASLPLRRRMVAGSSSAESSPVSTASPSKARLLAGLDDEEDDDDEDDDEDDQGDQASARVMDEAAAQLERLKLTEARRAVDGVFAAVSSTMALERERAASAARTMAMMTAPVDEGQDKAEAVHEQRRRARMQATDELQASLERESRQSYEVLQTLADMQKAARQREALLQQQQKELQLQQERQRVALEKAKLELQRRTLQEKQQQQQQPQQPQQPAQPQPQQPVSATQRPHALAPEQHQQQQPPQQQQDAGAMWKQYQALADAVPPDQKANLLRLKMPLTKALNQVTPEPEVTLSKAKEIVAVLQQAQQLSPTVYKVLQFHFAWQICSTVISKISTKRENVFPFAALTAFAVHKVPELWPLLVSGLRHRCPLLVPTLLDRAATETVDAYKRRLGCEKDNIFVAENNAFVTFFAGLCCAQVSRDGNLRTCMPRLGELWTLLAALLNQRPMYLVPDLVLAILEVAGVELMAVYGRQMRKLLVYVHDVYLPVCSNASSTRDRQVDTALVLGLKNLIAESKASNFSMVPSVHPTIQKDFVPTKRKFQMRPI